MDSSFTQHVLGRARERQRKLEQLSTNEQITPSTPTNSKRSDENSADTKLLDSATPVEKKTPLIKHNSSTKLQSFSSPELKTLNIQRDNFNMEIKLVSSDNVRVEVEIQDSDTSFSEESPSVSEKDCEKKDESGLRQHARKKLNKLGQLYAGGDEANISSPIYRTEEHFLSDERFRSEKRVVKDNDKAKSKSGLSKLAELSKKVDQWEDDNVKSNIEEAVTKKSETSVRVLAEKELCKDNHKTFDLDQKTLKTLELQGFTRTATSQLIYNYNAERNKEGVASNLEKEKQKVGGLQEHKRDVFSPKEVLKNRSPIKFKKEENKLTPRPPIKSAISNKIVMFESSPSKTIPDPSSMSIAERKALFEKNRDDPLVPKAAFAMAIPLSSKEDKIRKDTEPKSTPTKIIQNSDIPDTNQVSNIAKKIAALVSNQNTIGHEQVCNNIKEQRQKDMEILLNRFNKNKDASGVASGVTKTPQLNSNEPKSQISTPERRKSGEKRTKKSDSPHVSAVLEDIKRIKVNQPKQGHLYPSLSDIETANETETDQVGDEDNSEEGSFCSSEDGATTNFEDDIIKDICKKQSLQKRQISEEDDDDSDLSGILDDIEEYSNENTDYSNGPTPPKLGKVSPKENERKFSKPSESFQYKNCSPTVISPKNSPPELPTHILDGENVLPLLHTVSFYRKQQTPVKTPIRRIERQPVIAESVEDGTSASTSTSRDEKVFSKIEELTNEIYKQQNVISQTSRALNLCNSTLEFIGSSEQVEAEKLLLLATNRRQACLYEIQRLKVEGTIRPQSQHSDNIPMEKGNISISNIILPLKKEYVRALTAAGGKGHHVICLIKSGEHVLSTQLVSTVASSPKNPDYDLYIPGSIQLNDIYSNFTATFEVYCLQAQEECLPHDLKYHINKKGGKVTPKKSKQDFKLISKESPGGPQAVRSPTFALMGYVIFSIHSLNKTNWTLNKVPSMSPLEGKVEMRISCDLNVSIEHQGFLTMFEDISGFGAWHRRWVSLKDYTFSYWKYPDDEKKKPPIETIDLKQCIAKQVGPVSRDICARPHTFLIETQRDAFNEDKESLTRYRKDNKTVIRHLLSADTKEERIIWCQMFNKVVAALQMWGKN